jgi:hypothetical protein
MIWRPALILFAGVLLLTRAPQPDDDRMRIQAHLRQVTAELRAADVSALSAAQHTARIQNIERLSAYADAGVFPHNHDFRQRTPYFRDAHGTLCAMAYLIEQSGSKQLVDRVARRNNNAFIRELASDAELVGWLEANGLTAQEAARIQPTYGGQHGADPGYALATALVAGLDGGVIVWNLMSEGPRDGRFAPGLVAFAASGLSFLAFGAGIGTCCTYDNDALIGLNLAATGATALTGVINTVRALNARARKPDTPRAPEQSAQLTPILTRDVRGRTKLGLHVAF